jgi:hypothetical protein
MDKDGMGVGTALLTRTTSHQTPIESEGEPGSSRRRFILTVVVANVAAAFPFLWNLWAPWQSVNPLRRAILQTNFYDLQARAIFHGHLWIPNGSIGIEAFVHDGHQYTYFGLFPSIIRMPILLVTSSLDGRMTAPFMLLSWLLTGLFGSMLLWRVRVLLRGDVALGWSEALSYGLLIATTMGGSVWLTLAATPYVFNEDLAWSICLTVGSLFALLGVLERPSRARVIATGLVILAANLDRVTTGWACVAGAVLVAVWFGLGRGGQDNRRWCVPILIAGLVPLVIGCAVNFAKFGVPFGLPVVDQLYTKVNVYRREFLRANHNSEVGTAFIPTDAVAYLRLDGIRFTSVFPFITLPATPAASVAGVLFDKRYRTASLPSSMPLLFLLGCWGMVTAFRPRPIGRLAPIRLLLLASGAACAALLLWGYIAPRYLADFIPFLLLACAIGMVDIWRRMEGRSHNVRVLAVGVIAVVAAFSVAANVGMAITPNEEWTSGQALNFVEVQKAISDVTGHPLNALVTRADTLPPYGPADQLYIVGNCDGLYVSEGEDYSTVPSESFTRTTWLAVQRGHTFQHTFEVTFRTPTLPESIPLVSAGRNTISVDAWPTARHRLVRVLFQFNSPGKTVYGITPYVPPGTTHRVVVVTDPAKHLAEASMDGTVYMASTWDSTEPITADTQHATAGGTPPVLTVTNITGSTPQPGLCRSLNRSLGTTGHGGS